MQNTLITLAHIHYDFGLIGVDEFAERIEVARWLDDPNGGDAQDPRLEPGDDAPSEADDQTR